VDTLKARPRSLAIAAAALIVLAAAVGLWSVSRRLPVAETRRFLTAPIQVGETPPPAPAAPAPQATVTERLAEAKTAFQEGRYPEAATAFAWVVSQDPAGPEAGSAQWNLTRSRLRSGDASGALAALEDLLGHYAGYIGQQAPAMGEGLAALNRGDLQTAQAAFERMTREQPDSEFVPLAWALVARIHWAHGEAMETVQSFSRMFASVHDVVPAYARLAHQLDRYAKGEPGVAETFGELAETGDPEFRSIYQYLAARSLLEQDQFDATRGALEKLRRQYPDGDFTHIVDLEQAWNDLRHGQAADALAIFERLEHTPPPERSAAFDAFFDLRNELPMGVARCHLALGHHAEAAAAFERALSEHPDSMYAVENRLGLASAYEGLGQLDRASAELRRIIAEHPDEPKLWAVRQQLARIEQAQAAAR
jgi:outer membrane protein assembly factor BamD (BamD/ComL family)